MLLELWQSKHRPHLHHPECWSSNRPSLTYVPTGAGFTGSVGDLAEAEHPLFHPDQLDRFAGQMKILSAAEDVNRGMIWEEVVIEGAVHQSQWDWLIPGQPATRRQFTVAMAFTARYEAGLLKEVRIWWDQASLLEQLGIKPLVAIDGRSCAQRLLHPNPNNANFALKTLQEVEMPPKVVHLPPPKPIVPHKALVSSVFSEEMPVLNVVAKSPKALTSTLQLTDEVDYVPRVLNVAPVEILPPVQEEVTAIPSFAVDPHKFDSKVFSAPSPFKPRMSYRHDRFESHLFEDENLPPRTVKPAKPEVVEEEEITYRPSVKINQAHLKSQFTFG